MTISTAGSSVPITTRSGLRKSSTAVPSFRNSGFETTAKGCFVSARHHLPHPGRGPHRHRGLVDDDLVAVHRAGDAPRDVEHVGQVRGAVLVLRRPDRDEDHLARPHRLLEVGREAQALLGDVARDHLVEAGLVDRDLAPPQPLRPSPRRCRRRRRSSRSRRDTPPPPARRTRFPPLRCARERPSLAFETRPRLAHKPLLLSFASRWTSASTCAPPSPGRPGWGPTSWASPSACPPSRPTTASTSSRRRSRSATRRGRGPRTSASWTAACRCAG